LHWPDAWAYQGPLSELAERSPQEQEDRTFPTDAADPETADVSLSETWRRLEQVCKAGLTRTIGVCNVSVDQLETILDTARIPPAIVQVESHPYRPRTDLIATCHAEGIRVLAHSPLSAPGLLDDPVLSEVAAVHDTTPAAVGIAYHVDRGVVPIPASNDPDHIVANLAAARLELTDADRDRLATLEDPGFER
jgi:alcohol dehydrogenase (NADP+)